MNKIKKLSLADKFLIGMTLSMPFILYDRLSSYTSTQEIQESAQVVETAKSEKPKIQLEEKINQSLVLDTDGNFLNDSESILLARAIYGEARGEFYDTKVAIAQTILNRTGKNKWWGNTLHEVLLKQYQFSCFNQNDPNYQKLQDPLKYEDPKVWEECYDVAEKVLNHNIQDISQGATHYCTNNPSWAKNKQPLFTKGKTKFYKLAN